jgi:Ni/Co efflux regulator RcnB
MTMRRVLAAAIVLTFAGTTAIAADLRALGDDVYIAQGKGKGNDKGGGNANAKKGGAGNKGGGNDFSVGKGGGESSGGFVANDRVVVKDYFSGSFAGGCPPGLAKKGNGCMPPGQAKKWSVGQRLPRDVQWYEVPRDLYVRLTPPPVGYRYVRVGADVLLMAIATSIIIDAIIF